MKTPEPNLDLQKHLEAMLSSLALRGWSSTQKTCKNSIYNIHIYKYIYNVYTLGHSYSQEEKKK